MKRETMAAICAKLGIANPWPTERPNVEADDHNWFTTGEFLGEIIESDYLVLELGAWLGSSTRFMAEKAAFVITIDHWLGSAEHQETGSFDVRDKLPRLYETFLRNCWDYRAKILPLRMRTLDGMALLLSRDVVPDLIYIDADHSYEGCARDIEAAFRFGKNTIITGDDWWWGSDLPVRRAVLDFAKAKGMSAIGSGNFWRLYNGTGLSKAFAERDVQINFLTNEKFRLENTVADLTNEKFRLENALGELNQALGSRPWRIWSVMIRGLRVLLPPNSVRYKIARFLILHVLRSVYHFLKRLIHGPGISSIAVRPLRRRVPFTVVIPTINSSKWILAVNDYYRSIGVSPFYCVDARTSDDTVESLREARARFGIASSNVPLGDGLVVHFKEMVNSQWILRIDDDECPSEKLISWIRTSGCLLNQDIVAFHRRWLWYASEGKLEYAASKSWDRVDSDNGEDRQYRLYRKESVAYTSEIHTPGFVVTGGIKAPSEAILYHFDWILRTKVERIAKLARYDAMRSGAGSSAAKYYLPEDIVRWDYHGIIDDPKIKVLAERLSNVQLTK